MGTQGYGQGSYGQMPYGQSSGATYVDASAVIQSTTTVVCAAQAIVQSDTDPPVVFNLTPEPNSIITATQPIGFDVTDNVGIRRVFLYATFANGIAEVVHDGDQFCGLFSRSSTRVAITNGYRFSILRWGGWPSSPSLRIVATDMAGNEAA